MAVHRELGNGFLEAVYREAFGRTLVARKIPFTAEAFLPVEYGGERLKTCYRADFVCYGGVIVEIKALKTVAGRENAQVLNYLKASGLQRGLLINFGLPRLQWRRFVWSPTGDR